MSNDFDYENRKSENDGDGSSVEYGPRFFGEGANGYYDTGKKKKNRTVALLLAIAVVLVTVTGIGGVLLGRQMASGGLDGDSQNGGSAGGNAPSGGTLKDTVVMYQTTEKATIGEQSVAAVAAKSAGSVVEIMTASAGTGYTGKTVSGAGSGVIISESKTQEYTYIVTNNHVVEGFETIIVRTTSGKEYSASVVGTDWLTDIAVLRIRAKGLSVATYVSGETPLVLGQQVVAIGNPLGALGGSVSDGIISGLSRTITIEGIPMTLLQTDAAINPGNSGGGLFDMNGNLVGIVNAKSVAEGVDNIGFAIPIETAMKAVSEIIKKGYVSGRADLGFTFTTSTTTSGLTVYSYAYNNEISTPIQSGYILYSLTVNGKKIAINSIENYRTVLASVSVGDTVQAQMLKPRRQSIFVDYKEFTVNLTVHEYTP